MISFAPERDPFRSVVKSVLEEVPLGVIFKGIVPFFFASLAGLALIIQFPQISLLLPGLMR